LKLPTDNDPAGDLSRENELDELQKMVQENEQALKRANKMIADLRKHLGKPSSTAGKSTPRKKK
jgi:hypothetical protein